MWPGFDSRTRRHMWVEFVVGSLLCSERFFPGNISKFQFDPGMHEHFKRVLEKSCALWVNKFHFLCVSVSLDSMYVYWKLVYVMAYSLEANYKKSTKQCCCCKSTQNVYLFYC